MNELNGVTDEQDSAFLQSTVLILAVQHSIVVEGSLQK